MKRIKILLIIFTSFILSNQINFSQSITWLGTLGGSESQAWDISSDGQIVVGCAKDSLNRFRAFRWTKAQGMQDLGTLGGLWSGASGISYDGEIIVGGSHNYKGNTFACVWSGNTISALDTINSIKNTARKISGNGNVIVGSEFFKVSPDRYHAYIWKYTTGMVDIGTLGGNNSSAADVSYDGSVVVGISQLYSSDYRAFRWTAGNGMQDLGTIGWQSAANAVSGNGLVVAGDCNQSKAFRWTTETGMYDLGNLGKVDCSALDLSYDGSIIVGWARRLDEKVVGFKWTQQTGMQDLNVIYSNLLDSKKILNWATAITPDGRFIVGYGYLDSISRYEAYLLDTGFSTDVIDNNKTPQEFYLAQNYPNPFNPSTKIIFVIPSSVTLSLSSRAELRDERSRVQLKVFDVLGNEVATLVDEYKPAGRYEVEFNTSAIKHQLSSGVYFYQLKVADPEINSGQVFIQTKKMLYLK